MVFILGGRYPSFLFSFFWFCTPQRGEGRQIVCEKKGKAPPSFSDVVKLFLGLLHCTEGKEMLYEPLFCRPILFGQTDGGGAPLHLEVLAKNKNCNIDSRGQRRLHATQYMLYNRRRKRCFELLHPFCCAAYAISGNSGVCFLDRISPPLHALIARWRKKAELENICCLCRR